MDALREWMETDVDVIMESDLDVIMVGPCMLRVLGCCLFVHGCSPKRRKSAERTETATKKRRISRQNAVETVLPAYNARKKQQNLEFRNSENEQTQRRRNAQKLTRKTHVVDQNLETATTKTDPNKASGRQVSRLAKTTSLDRLDNCTLVTLQRIKTCIRSQK